jgi:hypothetical protein
MMRDLVFSALPDARNGARAAHNIARLIWSDYGSLRQQAGRVAAVSRALNTLRREGKACYSVRVYGRTVVTEWWRLL